MRGTKTNSVICLSFFLSSYSNSMLMNFSFLTLRHTAALSLALNSPHRVTAPCTLSAFISYKPHPWVWILQTQTLTNSQMCVTITKCWENVDLHPPKLHNLWPFLTHFWVGPDFSLVVCCQFVQNQTNDHLLPKRQQANAVLIILESSMTVSLLILESI